MLFSDKVPLRLHDKTVIVARERESHRRASETAELVDEDEAGQAAWRHRFCELHRLSAESVAYGLVPNSVPPGLTKSLRIAQSAELLPIHRAVSTPAPDDKLVMRSVNRYQRVT